MKKLPLYLSFIDNKEKEKIQGIYGIMIDNEIVYIGQSTDIAKRCKCHALKIIKEESKCKKYNGDLYPVYIETRRAFYNYQNIKFVILERIKDESKLIEKELYYMDKYQPKLNIHTW